VTDKKDKPKTSTRRARSDSTGAEIAASQAALAVMQPPETVNISDDAMKFWDVIILSRAADAWTGNDLMLAGILARCYADIEKYSVALSSSRLIKDEKGQPKISPAHKIVDDLYKQALSLSRTLQIHPRATQGESRDQTTRNEMFADKRNNMAQDEDDQFLARPDTH